MRIRFYEWLIGKLLVRSAKLRVKRDAPGDRHEVRHLAAGLLAANSSPCDDGCHLRPDTIRQLHKANFGEHADAGKWLTLGL